ncbi:MAG: hypothetical protein QGI83_21935, partial [Candidatus Latescibacteria bacterium]|nr:hypothetical protein [Candidatus Latescibacterota bacterium]
MARIFKRNRTWWIDCGIVGGRRKRHSLETTSKRRAQEALAAYERRRALGEEEELKAATFTEFVDVYLELKAGRKSPRSRERDGHALKHLKPTFGEQLLQAITQEEIEAWVALRSQEK